MERRLIVERDLLARLDVAECDKENMVMKYFHVAVWFAGMIDVMRSVTALAAIEAPAFIDRADTQASSPGTAISFGIRYSLAPVLRYLPAAHKMRPRETTLAFNSRVLDFQSGIQLKSHLECLRVPLLAERRWACPREGLDPRYAQSFNCWRYGDSF